MEPVIGLFTGRRIGGYRFALISPETDDKIAGYVKIQYNLPDLNGNIDMTLIILLLEGAA